MAHHAVTHTRPRPLRHRALGAAVGVAGLALAWRTARSGIPAIEAWVFRRVNTVPTPIWWASWPTVQLGNLAAPLVVAAVAARVWRGREPAATVLASAYGAWALARLVRSEVVRARPVALLADVLQREHAVGPGFVSGHAAIASGTAVALWPYLGQRARVITVVAVVWVDLGRVMAGAHLPLDVIGGTCLGLLAGLTVQTLLPRPPGGLTTRG